MRHLCKTLGFECRAVAFTTARHHRRGSAIKPAWCANNRGGNVAKKLLRVITDEVMSPKKPLRVITEGVPLSRNAVRRNTTEVTAHLILIR